MLPAGGDCCGDWFVVEGTLVVIAGFPLSELICINHTV